eukprot:gnl/MRDRNA2_/MRDRNA2_113243_c0_seq1.p1 gnl/MRDRNA2_/MRDRNA2_113243_c0~~gnl/MRDRNA2_/MRDRNA2_113243_c0_seq1.p1  ORF type:complete len:561 (+),score=119.14 gnl/MRDRNA2_/MRDRNA2_113243_c0_seq1:93-1775(+)
MRLFAFLLGGLAPCARADLPLHCLPEDALGTWTFISDGAKQSNPQSCGHSMPNTVKSTLDVGGEEQQKKQVAEVDRVKITLTHHVEDGKLLAFGEKGEKGSWTMMFDEGLEVRLGDRSYFAHFQLSLLPGKEAHEGDNLEVIGQYFGRVARNVTDSLDETDSKAKIYACHCDHTSVGWESRGAGNKTTHGCFHAMREAPSKVSSLVSISKHQALVSKATLPKEWDWRQQPELEQPGDNLASEFDQGACGSCYAAAGVLSLSMRFRIELARQKKVVSNLDLSWRATTRCSPYTEGCNGGFPFLIGRMARDYGIFQKTTTTLQGVMAAQCNADHDPEQAISGTCPEGCEMPDQQSQPVYYAADYGYVGGFAQGASEELIMREIYDNGPVAIELAVRAIPELFGGNMGEPITDYNNQVVKDDHVLDTAAEERLKNATTASVKNFLGAKAQPFKFKKWMWVDHALLSVGWGEAQAATSPSDKQHIILGTTSQLVFLQRQQPASVKYWTIRNSWGEEWAAGGYGKLVRGVNAGGVEISAVWIKPDLTRLPSEVPIVSGQEIPAFL